MCYLVLCDVMSNWCVWSDVSTGNNIGNDGAMALNQCLTSLNIYLWSLIGSAGVMFSWLSCVLFGIIFNVLCYWNFEFYFWNTRVYGSVWWVSFRHSYCGLSNSRFPKPLPLWLQTLGSKSTPNQNKTALIQLTVLLFALCSMMMGGHFGLLKSHSFRPYNICIYSSCQNCFIKTNIPGYSDRQKDYIFEPSFICVCLFGDYNHHHHDLI